MKHFKNYLFILALMISLNIHAQQTAPKGTPSATKTDKKGNKKPGILANRMSISLGGGTSNYLGDLMRYNVQYRQTSYSFSAGLVYQLLPHLNARLDLGYQKLQGSDSKKGGAHRHRNLSFKSNNFDISAALEFEFFNMHKYKFSPYIFGGIGILFFDPYAIGAAGNKQKLRDLGTEGQGLFVQGFKSKYKRQTYEFPAGIGLKYAATKRLMIQLEYNFRATGSDYLDDVSQNTYVSKALLDARNPTTAKFAYRGNEVPGGEPYPVNGRGRGNPAQKDNYYTTQLKVVYAIKLKADAGKEQVNLPVTEAQKDTDGDGIFDVIDRCPDVAGLKYLQGCADKDGDGIADIDDKCPDVAGFTRYLGCPIPDADADGVDDEQDKCPTVAGTTRYQGCPVTDTDGDGVNDEEDKCITQKGDAGNFGCPPISEDILNRIKLAAKKIFFTTGRAELLSASFASLNEVVKILNDNPSYKIQINGHTDNTGDDLMNQSLSEARAAAVRNYMTENGIDESRLFSTGYGEINPIADNNTVSGRTENRRVEMVIRNY